MTLLQCIVISEKLFARSFTKDTKTKQPQDKRKGSLCALELLKKAGTENGNKGAAFSTPGSSQSGSRGAAAGQGTREMKRAHEAKFAGDSDFSNVVKRS